jgi:murein L,D-transpeptidase YafK
MTRKWFILVAFTACMLAVLTYYFYPYSKIPAGVVIDKIVVLKSQHLLFAYSHQQLVHTYTVAIGKTPTGDKQFEGDKKTPEGNYFIFAKNPNSGWHKNLGISYPNAEDITAAQKLGLHTGGDIKIHGLKNGRFNIGRFHRWKDWTNGCIALTNEEVEDLYNHTPVGTPIIIQP